MMKNKILLSAALVAIGTVNFGIAEAANVTEWSGLSTTENITILNDITASGTPKVISLSSTIDQTINGGGFSITGANGYSFTLNNVGNYIFENLGHYTAGTAANNTFSYSDLNGETQYVSIDASVNSFPAYFMTRYGTGTAVNVNNSVFTNNGGRIIVLSGSNNTLNLSNSVFYNNSSDKNVAIISGNGTFNIENSIFYNNHNTKNDGGAIDAQGTINVKNSYFINNVADDDFGGAINLGGGANLTIEGSKFVGNIAGYGDGGAIGGVTSSTLKYIKDSEFVNNSTTWGDGGAVSLSGGFIEAIDNTVFDGNFAYTRGGAIWAGLSTSSQNPKPPILINNTVFRNNEAGSGGALFTEGAARENYTYITNSEFTDNTATGTNHDLWYGYARGGGLEVARGGVPVTINNTTFSGNVADPGNDYSAGGAIYFIGKSASYPLKIIDSTFSNNSALEGGAVFIDNADTAIIAATKDVVFSGNTAGADADDYNGGADIYFQANIYSGTLSLNAAEGKKVVFNGSIASYLADDTTSSTIDINNSGVTYNTYDGETETAVTAGTAGEIQFNGRVGDETQYFTSINLYGGKLSIGQNAVNNALTSNPDGYINDNNFYVKGDSTLSTVNNVIGSFAPRVFNIESGVSLDYMFDVDLAQAQSDTLVITDNSGTLRLSSFNVISDSDVENLKIKYSDTNVGGVVKEGYTITTSTNTYDVTADNDSTGSYIIFKMTEAGGGLPSAIAAEADQYIITNGADENVTAWASSTGNVITSDIDINANGYSIYTENGIDGMVVSSGISATLRNIDELSGFNDALTNNGGTLSIIDSNITDNSGSADITNNLGIVNISAATRDIVIGSNNTNDALLSNGGTINVTGSNEVTFGGSVTGSNDAVMNISANTTFGGNLSGMNIVQAAGDVDLTNFSGADYTLNNGALTVQGSGSFSPDTFGLNGGTVNILDETAFSPQTNIFSGGSINAANGQIGNLNFNSLTLNDVINLAVDVDMSNNAMDTISATALAGSGSINVNQFNILSETNNPNISLAFAGNELKDLVSTDVTTIEGKIFRYNVGYDSENGVFNFAGGGGSSKGYSSSVMASPVAAQLQGYLTQLNSYDEAFRNMDMYMLLPSKVRRAMKYKNRLAINSSDIIYNADKNIYDNGTGWVRTHTTFEKVPLKNGPKVSNVAYGSYFGAESELYDLGKGWEGMWGVYAGYNGSHQSYNGISMYQNGGTLGLLGMAYKGNFFQGLTINTGANGGEAHSRYGKEDFGMLMAGIASKTGYNFEFKEGKYIVQPNMLLSYSFVNSFNYKNAAGVNISSDPLHAIQVEPGVKFIANLKDSWQPYASVSMVWNIMDKTHYMANNVALPELSVKPYVKYGVGVRKSWGERFTGFLQTYITNGGRNGVGIQAGFRWFIGGNKFDNKNIKL